ncbi:hypothetical protein BOX15_Mlig030936g3 [Macrostomum lignano]|uniref:RBR-type E3 ubiquitin transferase n=1 Tax=Macrostomum lignano TaxID=282301 RepID=A0A267GSY0_9PLAT|nr:hypothetical protein BOX15_Mlig030936g3 [Macrostomum lignano]
MTTEEPVSLSLQEIRVADGCDQTVENELTQLNPDTATVSDQSDSASDEELADDLDLEQLDVLAKQDTEEALERLKMWVCNKSRKLSLSSQDREIFARLTEKYFSELKSLSSKEAEAEPGTSSVVREADAVQSSSQPPSRTSSRTSSPLPMDPVRRRFASDTSSEATRDMPVNVEGSDSASGSERSAKILLFPEHAALFNDDSEEHLIMLEALQNFLSEERDYFHSISLISLFKLFKYLLMYHLESEYDFESRSKSVNLSRTTDTLVFYKRLFDTGLAPHTFRQVYEKLTETQSHLQINVINDRITRWENYHDIFMLHGMLTECFQVYQSRTGVVSGLERMNFRCSATCSLCLLDDQLVVARTCCGQHVCYACYNEWVRTKVYARTVEVGCPCCSCFLTVSEIIEFLGDRADRYYEILTDLNGDPNKKTCPQCNMVTKNPNEKASKRLGGELTRCQRCEFSWCFRCHSPPHPNMSCSANSSGKQMLRDWGLETYFDGSQFIRKARKCPSCKVYIEKNQGCNHMTCNRCSYQFCYVCGKNWRAGNFVFGRHSSRLSIFGCKQKLFPGRPALRKLVRGTLFVLEATGIVIAVPIGLALVIGLSPILGVIGLGVLIYKCKH